MKNNHFAPSVRLLSHPANPLIVAKFKKQIIDYIKSHYGIFERTRYEDWYVGITYSDKARILGHQRKRKLENLACFKSWYIFSFSNARTLEKELCSTLQLGSCQVIGGAKLNSKRVYVYNLNKSAFKQDAH